MFLTPVELAGLTGKTQPAAQCRALEYMEIPFKPRPRYSPAVTRADLFRALGAPLPPPERAEPLPSAADLWQRYLVECNGALPHKIIRRGERVPLEACVYLMVHGAAVRYVGQTVSLPWRMKYHAHQWWGSLVVIPKPDWWPGIVRSWWLDSIESMAIDRFRPSENIRPVARCAFSEVVEPLLAALPSEW